MDKALADLIKISNATGRDPSLVQGSGGNTSVKTSDGRYMYIKASGTELKDMSAKRGWRRMDISKVLSVIEDGSLARLDALARETRVVKRLMLACSDKVKSGARPSIESHLHSMLDRYVIHLHPVSVGCYVCAKKGKAHLEKLFAKEKYPPLWVPYSDPGYKLGRKIAGLVSKYKKIYGLMPTILFLEKHGLIITTATLAAGLKLVRRVVKICDSRLKKPAVPRRKPVNKQKVREAKIAIRKGVFEATGQRKPIEFFGDSGIRAFATSAKTKKMLSASVLTPIEFICSNGAVMWLEKCEVGDIAAKLKSQIKRGQKESLAFMVKDVGLFVTAKPQIASVIRDIQFGSLLARCNAPWMGGEKPLNRRQLQFVSICEGAA